MCMLGMCCHGEVVTVVGSAHHSICMLAAPCTYMYIALASSAIYRLVRR